MVAAITWLRNFLVNGPWAYLTNLWLGTQLPVRWLAFYRLVCLHTLFGAHLLLVGGTIVFFVSWQLFPTPRLWLREGGWADMAREFFVVWTGAVACAAGAIVGILLSYFLHRHHLFRLTVLNVFRPEEHKPERCVGFWSQVNYPLLCLIFTVGVLATASWCMVPALWAESWVTDPRKQVRLWAACAAAVFVPTTVIAAWHRLWTCELHWLLPMPVVAGGALLLVADAVWGIEVMAKVMLSIPCAFVFVNTMGGWSRTSPVWAGNSVLSMQLQACTSAALAILVFTSCMERMHEAADRASKESCGSFISGNYTRDSLTCMAEKYDGNPAGVLTVVLAVTLPACLLSFTAFVWRAKFAGRGPDPPAEASIPAVQSVALACIIAAAASSEPVLVSLGLSLLTLVASCSLTLVHHYGASTVVRAGMVTATVGLGAVMGPSRLWALAELVARRLLVILITAGVPYFLTTQAYWRCQWRHLWHHCRQENSTFAHLASRPSPGAPTVHKVFGTRAKLLFLDDGETMGGPGFLTKAWLTPKSLGLMVQSAGPWPWDNWKRNPDDAGSMLAFSPPVVDEDRLFKLAWPAYCFLVFRGLLILFVWHGRHIPFTSNDYANYTVVDAAGQMQEIWKDAVINASDHVQANTSLSMSIDGLKDAASNLTAVVDDIYGDITAESARPIFRKWWESLSRLYVHSSAASAAAAVVLVLWWRRLGLFSWLDVLSQSVVLLININAMTCKLILVRDGNQSDFVKFLLLWGTIGTQALAPLSSLLSSKRARFTANFIDSCLKRGLVPAPATLLAVSAVDMKDSLQYNTILVGAGLQAKAQMSLTSFFSIVMGSGTSVTDLASFLLQFFLRLLSTADGQTARILRMRAIADCYRNGTSWLGAPKEVLLPPGSCVLRAVTWKGMAQQVGGASWASLSPSIRCHTLWPDSTAGGIGGWKLDISSVGIGSASRLRFRVRAPTADLWFVWNLHVEGRHVSCIEEEEEEEEGDGEDRSRRTDDDVPDGHWVQASHGGKAIHIEAGLLYHSDFRSSDLRSLSMTRVSNVSTTTFLVCDFQGDRCVRSWDLEYDSDGLALSFQGDRYVRADTVWTTGGLGPHGRLSIFVSMAWLGDASGHYVFVDHLPAGPRRRLVKTKGAWLDGGKTWSGKQNVIGGIVMFEFLGPDKCIFSWTRPFPQCAALRRLPMKQVRRTFSQVMAGEAVGSDPGWCCLQDWHDLRLEHSIGTEGGRVLAHEDDTYRGLGSADRTSKLFYDGRVEIERVTVSIVACAQRYRPRSSTDQAESAYHPGSMLAGVLPARIAPRNAYVERAKEEGYVDDAPTDLTTAAEIYHMLWRPEEVLHGGTAEERFLGASQVELDGGAGGQYAPVGGGGADQLPGPGPPLT